MPLLDVIDYVDGVKRYAPNASRHTVQRIIRHLGIALQCRDSSYVACSDPLERQRVRERWLRKKLGLCLTDEILDQGIEDVCKTMQRDRHKCRVIFYYLLADKFGKLNAV